MDMLIVITCVGLLMCIWRFMLRPTIRDGARDSLFDLRDRVRTTYMQNGWAIDSPSYTKLRGLLNRHLRFIEEMSLIQIVYVCWKVSKRNDLKKIIQERSMNLFSDTGADERKFAGEIRREAIKIVTEYAIYSSFILMLICWFAGLFVIFLQLSKLCRKGGAVIYSVIWNSVVNFNKTVERILNISAGAIASKIMAASVLEDMSYRAVVT